MKLYDQKRSEQLKLAGMELAADNVREPLELARTIAKELALTKPDRCLCMDEVGAVLETRYGIHSLGPASGSLFKSKEWSFTGRYVKSTKITNHSRIIRVWRYIG